MPETNTGGTSSNSTSYGSATEAAAAGTSGMAINVGGSWQSWGDNVLLAPPSGVVSYSTGRASRGESGFFQSGRGTTPTKTLSEKQAEVAIKRIGTYKTQLRREGLPYSSAPAGSQRVDLMYKPQAQQTPYDKPEKYVYDTQTNVFIPVDFLKPAQREALFKEMPGRFTEGTRYLTRDKPTGDASPLVGPVSSQLVKGIYEADPSKYGSSAVAFIGTGRPDKQPGPAPTGRTHAGVTPAIMGPVEKLSEFQKYRIAQPLTEKYGDWGKVPASFSGFFLDTPSQIKKGPGGIKPVDPITGRAGAVIVGTPQFFYHQYKATRADPYTYAGSAAASMVFFGGVSRGVSKVFPPEALYTAAVGEQSLNLKMPGKSGQTLTTASGRGIIDIEGIKYTTTAKTAAGTSEIIKVGRPAKEYLTTFETATTTTRTGTNILGKSYAPKTSTTRGSTYTLWPEPTGPIPRSYEFASAYGEPVGPILHTPKGTTGLFKGDYGAVGKGTVVTEIIKSTDPKFSYTTTKGVAGIKGRGTKGAGIQIGEHLSFNYADIAPKGTSSTFKGGQLLKPGKTGGGASVLDVQQSVQKTTALEIHAKAKAQTATGIGATVGGSFTKTTPLLSIKTTSGATLMDQKRATRYRSIVGLDLDMGTKKAKKSAVIQRYGVSLTKKSKTKTAAVQSIGIGQVQAPKHKQKIGVISAASLIPRTRTRTRTSIALGIDPVSSSIDIGGGLGIGGRSIGVGKYKPPRFFGKSARQLERLTPRTDYLTKTTAEFGGGISLHPAPTRRTKRKYARQVHEIGAFTRFKSGGLILPGSKRKKPNILGLKKRKGGLWI